VRLVAVAALALAGATHAVRSAVVNDTLASRPDLAAKVWPGHPRVELALAMAGIGKAAAAGQAPAAESIDLTMAAARHAPLASEPFLIRGALALSRNRQDVAEALLVEASRRDPRSAAARSLLAQRYLSSGRPGEGLRQASVLVRLVSGGSAALVPALARYAKSPEAAPALRTMFAVNPEMRDLVLAELSNDAGNYATIMSLAGSEIGATPPSPAPLWQSQLLRALIERGELERSRDLWLRISGLRAAPAGIFNPQFAKLDAPAPFNWTIGRGDYGVAEPTGNNGLKVNYYGLSTAEFASQTMLLAPGNYRLSMQVTRDPGSDRQSGLSWSITCQPEGKSVLNLPISSEAGAARTLADSFTVPATCRSQSIRLGGVAIEFGSSEQVTISNLQLVREAR